MYHLYSHNDLDGVGCGILAKVAFGERVEVRYNSVTGLDMQVGRFLERTKGKEKQHEGLFITDLSVHQENEERLDQYAEAGGKVKLIDHHKTALHLNERSWGMVKVQYEDGRLASATSLFYEYLIDNGYIQETKAMDQFVELVRLYDTWEWEQTDALEAKRLNDLFFMVSIDEFEEKMVRRLTESDAFSFDEFEEKILDMEEEKIERYIRRKRREIVQTFINAHCVGIVHAESYHSEVGNELGKTYPHLDYIAILNMGGKKVSLRTIHDETDVSEIAGTFGGGGHAKAAGCPLTDEAFKLYVTEPFPLEPLRADAFKNVYNVKESDNGSLYINRDEDQFFLFPGEHGWNIQLNGVTQHETFTSFEEAERFIKRNYAAWLARDEAFVQYLMQQVKQAIQTTG
ncbi:oligoribonuclease [Bacillus paralicheniformis]|uniref:DHH family phosphoesterase n=2 Tax=Bacillus paralicheniformis TaxID=1648923 RepID=UPI0003423A76|nr:ribonuclease YngD [Bacillus paralicheniformis]KJD53352.1 oligoribonuclease [Bacillus amyloliquefaciens]AGN36551.1 putative ribonuclease YngD [Bacillus paralicheniformis ATCC 9945a]AYQ18805.1 oligoribonuclease [Bacillus paralicheniformis]KND06795.1 oligoribonuclease [Bacillus paralicheniformis]KRT88225.1 oligoribonuclease [Bacillus paralicheniformis]